MKEIPLSKGKVAVVDDGDFEWLSQGTWHLHPNGYAQGRLDGKRGYMHRFILGLGDGEECDHLNRDKLDNRRLNLRRCTRQVNQRNLPEKLNKHKCPGVYYRHQNNKYVARIRINKGRKEHLGSFDAPEGASAAYEVAKAERDAADSLSFQPA